MSPKQIVLVGTMAIVITFGAMLQEHHADAAPVWCAADKPTKSQAQDDFFERIGAASEGAVYEDLYAGKSLADICEANQKPVEPLIELQVAQLSEQLDQRLSSGSISFEQYTAHQEELYALVAASVYGSTV